MKPSPGQINDGQVPIPEFGSLLLPLAIVPITFFAIMRLRKKSRPLPQEQSSEDVN
jgi:flagellar biogenesis protein FliO